MFTFNIQKAACVRVSTQLWCYFLIVQKWSKGKQKEKLNHQVLFDDAGFEKMLTEVPKYKLITPSVLSDRLRINVSLARKALDELVQRGSIRLVSKHSKQTIYTRATNTDV